MGVSRKVSCTVLNGVLKCRQLEIKGLCKKFNLPINSWPRKPNIRYGFKFRPIQCQGIEMPGKKMAALNKTKNKISI